jgi:hypothetical protein
MAYGLFNLFFASAADGETGSAADGAFSFAFAPGAVAYANIPAGYPPVGAKNFSPLLTTD